jgi:hypothetical protein
VRSKPDLEFECLYLAKSPPARKRLAELISHAASSEPLWHLVETHVRFGIPLPTNIAGELLRERKTPTKRGRHARAEEIGRQRANDMACFVAVEYFVREKGLRITPACKQVGELMDLTRQSVCDAWEREKRRPLKKE